jgi:hypothetical protein
LAEVVEHLPEFKPQRHKEKCTKGTLLGAEACYIKESPVQVKEPCLS